MHPPAGFQPLRLTPRAEPAERVPLFYIGDVEFTIPARPGANVALQYLHIGSGQECSCIKPHGRGEAAANDYLLTELLGDDGYQALREYDDLQMADLAQLLTIAVQHTMGALEVPKEPASA
jgi:hypothetical protein